MSLRPTAQPDHSASVWIALILSVVLHVPLLYPLANIDFDDQDFEPTNFNAERELSVNLISEDQLEEEEKKEEEKKEEDEENAQFVSMPPPDVERDPDKANYLDQYASATEQEMVRKAAPGSPIQPEAQNQARKPNPDSPEIPQVAEPKEPEQTDEKKEEQEEAREEDGGELAESAPESVDVSKEVPIPEANGVPNPKSLFPTVANSQIVNPMGQGGSLDYLRDVAEGDKTLLNRKRSRYWAFFDRVKMQIAEEWSPSSEYRRRDPYGNVYGVKDRYSAVRVTLNGDGTVRQLYVARPSGLEFFDDEAVRSIRSAAPFHNPPEGLKDEDGLIHFTFGFFFEITSGSSLRIFN